MTETCFPFLYSATAFPLNERKKDNRTDKYTIWRDRAKGPNCVPVFWLAGKKSENLLR
jgi:hypothetical protein